MTQQELTVINNWKKEFQNIEALIQLSEKDRITVLGNVGWILKKLVEQEVKIQQLQQDLFFK